RPAPAQGWACPPARMRSPPPRAAPLRPPPIRSSSSVLLWAPCALNRCDANGTEEWILLREGAPGIERQGGKRRRDDLLVCVVRGDEVERCLPKHVDFDRVPERIDDPIFRHAEAREDRHLSAAIPRFRAA